MKNKEFQGFPKGLSEGVNSPQLVRASPSIKAFNASELRLWRAPNFRGSGDKIFTTIWPNEVLRK